MFSKIIYSLILLLSFNFSTITLPACYGQLAQAAAKDKSVLIGNAPPEFTFNADNIGLRNARLSDYRGKLVILDFWNIWCPSCITAMPKMQSLQKQFADSIVVLLVTANTAEQVEKLRSRTKILQSIRLPIITGDTVLSAFFKPVGFPLHVWIDSTGMICQMTSDYNTTAASIKNWLSGNTKRLAVRKDLADFNINTPLWEEGNGRQREYLKLYSLISSHIDYKDCRGSIKTDSVTGKLVWFHLINYPIYSLYQNAFCQENNIPYTQFKKRCSVLSKRIDKIVLPSSVEEQDDWAEENTWCYEMLVPPEKSADMYKIMRQDIDRYFSLKSVIKTRLITCLILEKITLEDKLNAKNSGDLETLSEDSSRYIISNRNIASSLLMYLQGTHPNDIVVDETGYKKPINMILPRDITNYASVKKTLRQYGLDLIKAKRKISYLEINDR